MKLEVIQYTLKCKEELDKILGAIDTARLTLFNSDLEEVYTETYQQLEDLRLSTHRAIELLNEVFDEFMKEL